MVVEMKTRGQVTIFIIFALIIVILIALFFTLRKPEIEVIDLKNPKVFIDGCVKDSVLSAIETLSKQGGDIDPKGSVMFKGKDITYLCYTSKFYSPCTNTRPSLVEHIEKEITDYVYPRISNCFNILKEEFEKSHSVEMGEEMNIAVKLKPEKVITNVERELKVSKDNRLDEYEDFEFDLNHPLYDLTKVAIEISNQESEFCNFDILGYMIIHPEYDLDKFRTGNSDIIYTVRDRDSGKEFVFAIRTCILSAGF